MRSETDNELSSYSNFPECPLPFKLESDKPVLPEIEHLRVMIGDGEFESLKAVLNRNADIFSKHKADIGCCNFFEHKIELEEHARRMISHKSEACRAEIEKLLEYDMIEPSKSPWACGVVMAKKEGDSLGSVATIKHVYPIPRTDESLSKLGEAKFFLLHWIWVQPSGRVLCERRTEKRLDLHVNWLVPDGSGFDQSNEEVRG